MHEKKYENIIKLSKHERYKYLIRKVADFETIYLIYGDLSEMYVSFISGSECVLVFPEKGFAEIYVSQNANSKVKEEELYQFLDWLEKDKTNELNIAVFPNMQNDARIVNATKFRKDIVEEGKQYE